MENHFDYITLFKTVFITQLVFLLISCYPTKYYEKLTETIIREPNKIEEICESNSYKLSYRIKDDIPAVIKTLKTYSENYLIENIDIGFSADTSYIVAVKIKKIDSNEYINFTFIERKDSTKILNIHSEI